MENTEFLIKHQTKKADEETTLTKEQKQTLDERYAASKERPESRIPWSELKEELLERFKPAQSI